MKKTITGLLVFPLVLIGLKSVFCGLSHVRIIEVITLAQDDCEKPNTGDGGKSGLGTPAKEA